MYQKIIKNVLAISWISVVIYFYFKDHTYYASGITPSLKYLLFVLIVPIIYGCYSLHRWFNEGEKTTSIKITIPRLLIAFLLLILLAGNAAFFVKTPSFYHGASIFTTSDGQLKEVPDLSQLGEGDTLVIASESAFEGTDNVTNENTDPSFASRFEEPSFWQIQWGLMTKSIGIILILSLITLIATSLGHTILKLIRKDAVLDIDHTIISFGTGLFGIILVSFIIGSLHILTTYSAWGMLIILLGISFKSLIETIKKLLKFNYNFETKFLDINLFIIFVLALFISMNFIDSISPLPRAWDGMNQYVNIAKRIEEAKGLIQIGGNYYWELFMSLGFIAFKWTTITLNLSGFYPALLSLIVLFVILRKFSSQTTSLLISAALYTTPLFLFHGVEENKVDLGVLLISIIAFLALYKGFFEENKKNQLILIGIAGLLSGFCLGIKLTSLILIFTLLTIILYKEFKKTGAISGIFFSIGIFLLTQSASITKDIPISNEIFGIIGIVLVATSIVLITARLIKGNFRSLLAPLIFITLSVIAFSPWMIKNYTETHSLSSNGLLFGENPQPTIDYSLLEGDLAIDRATCTSTGTKEELDRYVGYDTNAIRKYLTLPWHLTMNDIGVHGIYVDFGWIPLAMFIGLIPFIKPKKLDLKWAIPIIFFVTYWILWLITSTGIIWYGLPGFLAISILVAGLIENYKQPEGKFNKFVIGALVFILLIPALSFRLSSFGKGTLLLYTADIMTADEATTSIFPYGLEVRDLFEADQDGKYDLIWKVGTSLNYFIADNFWRTYNDQYLDDFNCLYFDRNPELMTERLKALGFGYIIFDYYTNTISIDPDGTLNEKYQAAIDYLLNYTDIVIPDYYRGHLVAKIKGT
ncbi:MAG: hypothetical protein WCT46_03160 [Candidatus Gracilibacteria bacterium]|jgi:hypothetical protein